MRRLAKTLISYAQIADDEAQLNLLLRGVKAMLLEFSEFSEQGTSKVEINYDGAEQLLCAVIPSNQLNQDRVSDLQTLLHHTSDNSPEAIRNAIHSLLHGTFDNLAWRGVPQHFSTWMKNQEQHINEFLWIFAHFYRALDLRYIYFFPCYFSAAKTRHPAVLALGFKEKLSSQDLQNFSELANRILHVPILRRRLSVLPLEEFVKGVRSISEELGRSLQNPQEKADDLEKRRRLWQAFFQTSLRTTFGKGRGVMPGFDETKPFGDELQERIRAILDDKKKPHYKKQLKSLDRWRQLTHNDISWAVANFWNAFGERVPAIVVNTAGKESKAEKAVEPRWLHVWDLFLRITNEAGLLKEGNTKNYTTVGQFVVNWGEEMSQTPPRFEIRIGPKQRFREYRDFDPTRSVAISEQPSNKELVEALRTIEGYNDVQEQLRCFFSHLEIPAEVVCRILFQELRMPESAADNLEALCLDPETSYSIYGLIQHWLSQSNGLSREERRKHTEPIFRVIQELWNDSNSDLWHRIHDDKELLLPYLRYMRSFLSIRYYNGTALDLNPEEWGKVEERVSDSTALLMLLGNLILALSNSNGCPNAAEPEAASGWHESWSCNYCIPTWSQNVSILYLATHKPLDTVHLNQFQIMTDRLIATAWAFDSVWKHQLERRQISERGRRAARAAIMSRWDPLESTCRHASLSIL